MHSYVPTMFFWCCWGGVWTVWGSRVYALITRYKEGKLLSNLKHPYVVRYRENFTDKGWLHT